MTEDNRNLRFAQLKSVATRQSQIRGLATLPPLPRRSQELLLLLLDPHLDMLRLAELVEQTPALAARILGVANSAFFGTQPAVKHIPDAIIRVLGLNLVRDLSVSFVLNQPFELKPCLGFDPIRFWTDSMGSAVLTQLLVTRLPLTNPPAPPTAYLAGLLHKLGLLALVHVEPKAMNTVFRQVERDHAAGLRAVEQQHLGLDHAMAGAELAAAWRLPATLAAVMGPAVELSGADELTTLVSLVVLCDCINRLLGSGDSIEQDPEIGRVLTALGVDFDTWPALIDQWRERTENIKALAVSFAGPNQ